MVDLIFNHILHISFIGTIAALFILFCRLITKNKFGINFQYAMGFILIVRLLMCFDITTSISIYNYVPSYDTTMMNIPSIINGVSNIKENIEKIAQNSVNFKYNLIAGFFNVFAYIWIFAIVIICLFMIFNILKINNNIKKLDVIYDEDIIDIFEKAKIKAGVNKNIKLIESNIVKSPCVYGFIKPKILIPKSLLNCKDKIKFEYIFLHELIHVKRHHILINYIIFTLSTIHWFNPFIVYALNKMKDDMEIICDLEVLCVLDNNEKLNYGNLLLDLHEISFRAPWLPQMAGIKNNKNKLKRRIKMIKKFNKTNYKKLSIIALAGIMLIGGSILTEGKIANANSNVNKVQLIEDKVDYDFVNDEEVIGKWEVVDFVKNEEDFTTKKTSWKGGLPLKNLVFLKDGKMTQPTIGKITSDGVTPVEWLKWTNGIVMHLGDKTASSYKIKEINGEKYMMYQWKSGDYIERGQKPCYYVLKQAK